MDEISGGFGFGGFSDDLNGYNDISSFYNPNDPMFDVTQNMYATYALPDTPPAYDSFIQSDTPPADYSYAQSDTAPDFNLDDLLDLINDESLDTLPAVNLDDLLSQ